MKKLILFFLVISSSYFAQEVEEDVANIITVAKREVEPANRIGIMPSIIDTVMTYKVIEYPLLSVRYETALKLEPILPAKVKLSDNKLPTLYHGFVKGGIGSYIMPLGELYYNNIRSKKYVYGINVKHLSSHGELKDYAPAKYDNTTFNAYAGIKKLTYSLLGDVYFTNYGVNRYGSRNTSASLDSISQRFKDLGGNVVFNSSRMDSLRLNYTLRLDAYSYRDKAPSDPNYALFFGDETNYASTNTFWYRTSKEIYAVDVNLKHNAFAYGNTGVKWNAIDTAFTRSNTLFNLKPSITTFAKSNRLKAKIGADITTSSTNDTTKFVVYPDVEVKYAMYDNVIIPYAGVKGGMKQTTFRSLSKQNAFIQSNPNLKNESTIYDAFLGIRGILSKQMEFNVSANFSETRNKALFVWDSSSVHTNRNQYNVIYDTVTMFKAEASLSYQLGEKLKLDGIARFYNYMAKNNSYAWNLPVYQFIVRGSYVLQDKFTFTLDINGEGGRKALVYDSLEAKTTFEDGQYAKNLGFILDANIGVEYQYTNRLSAFLQCNNVAAQQYYRWYNYPVQAFQLMGGLTFKF